LIGVLGNSLRDWSRARDAPRLPDKNDEIDDRHGGDARTGPTIFANTK
jgi:hypothetical protein